MTRSENEQELVLGNKQLLSAFFVVVALLGVFFVMGYIIGRNTATGDGSAKKSAQAEPVNSGQAIPADPPPPVATSAGIPQPEPVTDTPTPKRTAADKAAERTERAAAEETDRSEKTAKVESPVAKPAAVESSAGHTFLQVMAVKRSMADQMVKVLKERGFPALLGESSKPELVRVLVGPYAEAETLSKAKSDLKKMGFEPVVK